MSEQEKKKLKYGALIGGALAVALSIVAGVANYDFSDAKDSFCGCPVPSPLPIVIEEGK